MSKKSGGVAPLSTLKNRGAGSLGNGYWMQPPRTFEGLAHKSREGAHIHPSKVQPFGWEKQKLSAFFPLGSVHLPSKLTCLASLAIDYGITNMDP